jgi:hypothetical protein
VFFADAQLILPPALMALKRRPCERQKRDSNSAGRMQAAQDFFPFLQFHNLLLNAYILDFRNRGLTFEWIKFGQRTAELTHIYHYILWSAVCFIFALQI